MRMTKTLIRRRGFINRLKTQFFIFQNGDSELYSIRQKELKRMSSGSSIIRSGRTAPVKALTVIIAVVAVATIIIGGILATSSPVSGGIAPKNIRGYVKDNIGNPLEGANVTVNITRGPITYTMYDDTNATGFYSVTFTPSEWEEGDFINVTAKYDSNRKNESTVADLIPFQFVNITFGFVIPEFSGPALVGALLGVIIIFAVFRRQNSSE